MNQVDRKGPAVAEAEKSRPPVIRKRRVMSWLLPVLTLGVGLILGIIVTLGFLLLILSRPISGALLAQPTASNKPDANLTLSQEYINREIAAYLKSNPIKIVVLEVKQVLVTIKPGNQISMTARAEAFGRQVDLSLKDNVSVKDGKVVLGLAEPVNAGGFDIPLLNLNGLVDNVNNIVAAEINKLIAGVGSSLPQHVPHLQSIQLGEGFLVAIFDVQVNGESATTTAAPTTAAATTAPATTAAPVTTAAPASMAAPSTTAAPSNTTAPVTTAVVSTTAAPATTEAGPSR